MLVDIIIIENCSLVVQLCFGAVLGLTLLSSVEWDRARMVLKALGTFQIISMA